jgi:glutathione S-transferase
MIKLYHAGLSVCSIKVRLGLAEKELEWESCPVDIRIGEQYNPEYLKLNPNAVVPTLVHDDFVVIESSIILEYLDSLSEHNMLMPDSTRAKTLARIWLLRCLDIHAAINTMTFSTVNREKILSAQTPEQIEKSIDAMPNPLAAAKRRDLLTNGIASSHLFAAFFTLQRLFEDMQNTLITTQWMTGESYGIVDTALLAYVDRIDRLGMAGLWQEKTPAVGDWLTQSKARPSYNTAIDPFINQQETEGARKIGDSLWPEVEKRWQGFLKA